MKKILQQNNIKTAKYKIVKDKNTLKIWNYFPCITKPSDSSAGRGLSYCEKNKQLKNALNKAKKYSNPKEILIEEYIKGKQFSIETISCKNTHQIVAINQEHIHKLPHIMEISHTIPANTNKKTKKLIKNIIFKVLDIFDIKYGACHIELKITPKNEIYIIEIASRTGGMRSEMINFAYGINYSQLLLLASLDILSKVKKSRKDKTICNFIIDYKAYKKYLQLKNNNNYIVFEPFDILPVQKGFKAEHIGVSKGYYFVLESRGNR
jgi:carbamoyl-phosphate synthase large subunit